jgi:hypothetical protein
MYEGRDLHFQIAGNRLVGERLNEMDRLALWQRIAPPMPSGYGIYTASNNFLVDKIVFRPGDTWFKPAIGKMVHQSAPAIMARNIDLPKVDIEGEPPYVMASKFPNGSIAIATEGRVRPAESWYHPRADIQLSVGTGGGLIGVFGHYNSLTLNFESSLSNAVTIWAQDLLSKKASDITKKVFIKKHSIIIPGELIDKIGSEAGTEGDISAPGLVMRIDS